MKNTVFTNILVPMLAAMAVALMTACGSKPDDAAYQYVGASDMIVARVSISDLYENAGCEIKDGNIILTGALRNLSQATGLSFLQMRGVDPKSDVLIFMPDENSVAVAFTIDSHANFREFLRDAGVDFSESEEDGLTVYRLARTRSIFCEGSSALLLSSGIDPVSIADYEALKARAASNPLKPWQLKALKENGSINIVARTAMIANSATSLAGIEMLGKVYDPDALKHGYFKFSGTIKGLEAEGSGVFTDSVGNTLDGKVDKFIDTELLKYANSKELAAIMLALPKDFDWQGVMSGAYRLPQLHRLSPEAKQAISHILKDVDGTVMLAAGPESLIGMNTPGGWNITLAAQFNPEKAAAQLENIKKLLESQGANYNAANHGGTIVVQLNGGDADAQESITIPAHDIDGMCAAFAINVPRENVFSTLISFPFGVKVVYGTDGTTLSFSAELTDCDGLLLENIINLLSGNR